MNDTPKLERKMAYEVPCGHAVLIGDGADSVFCIKVEREGRDFVHHYVVPLDPMPAGPLTLVYVDPEDSLVDCGGHVAFTFGRRHEADRPAPAAGDVIETPAGVFLMVNDLPSSRKLYGFVDLSSGDLRRRQDRKVTAVYDGWEAHGTTSPARASAAALREASARLDRGAGA